METNPITIRVQIDGKEETFKLDAQNPVKAGLKQDTVRKEARSIFQSDIMKTYDSTDYRNAESISYGKKNNILDAKEQSVFLGEVAKAAGEDKVLSSEEFDKFVSDKFYDGKPLTEAQQRNHRYFLRDIADKQIKENPKSATPQTAPQAQPAKPEAPQTQKAEVPKKVQGETPRAQGEILTAQGETPRAQGKVDTVQPKATAPTEPAKAPVTPAQPAKAEAPQPQKASAEAQVVEPKNKEGTVDKWGSKAEKGKLANDCLERIIKNNYPEIKPYSKEYNALMKEIATKNPEAFGKTKDGKPNLNIMKTGTKIELPAIDKKTGKITEAPAKTEAEAKGAEPSKQQALEGREATLEALDKAIKDHGSLYPVQVNGLNDLKPYITRDNAEKLQKQIEENKGQPVTRAMRDAIEDAKGIQEQITKDLGFFTSWNWSKTDAEKTGMEALRIALVEEGLKPDSKEYQERVSAAKESIKQAEVERALNLSMGYGFGH